MLKLYEIIQARAYENIIYNNCYMRYLEEEVNNGKREKRISKIGGH